MGYGDKKITIELTNHNTMIVHNLLAKESRRLNCEDDYSASQYRELVEIDKAIGYSGNFEY